MKSKRSRNAEFGQNPPSRDVYNRIARGILFYHNLHDIIGNSFTGM